MVRETRSDQVMIWSEQCERAYDLMQKHDSAVALDYMVGEIFLGYLEASKIEPRFGGMLGPLARRIRLIFEEYELDGWFRKEFGAVDRPRTVRGSWALPQNRIRQCVRSNDRALLLEEAGRWLLVSR